MLYLCKYCISGLLAVELFQDEVQEVYMFPSAPKKNKQYLRGGQVDLERCCELRRFKAIL